MTSNSPRAGAEIRRRTDVLVARADAIRRSITAAADELSGLTTELRALLADSGEPHERR